MKEKTKSAWKLTAGIALLVQSLTFVVVFLMLYKKKKSIAGTFLAIGAAGGIAGCVLLMQEMRKLSNAADRAATDDSFLFDEDDEDMFDESIFNYGDYSDSADAAADEGNESEESEESVEGEDAPVSDAE